MSSNSQEELIFDVYDLSLAIEYYSNFLYKLKGNAEFPIQRLIGRRGQAPPEVQRVAANAMELKRFLSRFPTVFTVLDNDSVKLARTVADYQKPEIEPRVESNNDSDQGVQFYAKILGKKLSTGNCTSLPVQSLIGHRSQASAVVQSCARNVEELCLFLSSHPETFDVLPGKLVALRKSPSVSFRKSPSVPNNVKKNNSNPGYKGTDSALAVEYYSKILKTTGPDYPIISLIGHRGQAPIEVKNVAHTDKQLKLFLSRFPDIFSISGKFVTLRKVPVNSDIGTNDVLSGNYSDKSNPNILSTSSSSSVASKIVSPNLGSPKGTGILVPGSCSEKSNPNVLSTSSYVPPKIVVPALGYDLGNPDAAVQFYVNILKKKGCDTKAYPISKLTGYGSQAPLEVQNCAKNPRELCILFSNYPKIFTVTANKCVRLVESPLNTVNKVQNLPSTSSDSSKAVEYYANILRNGHVLPIAEFMDYLNQAPADVRRVARNIEELMEFFLQNSNVFTVVQNKFVKLVDTSIDSSNMKKTSINNIASKVQNVSITPNVSVKKTSPLYNNEDKVQNISSVTNAAIKKNPLPVPTGPNKSKSEKESIPPFRYYPTLDCSNSPKFSGSWEDHVLDNTNLITEVDECLEACEVIKKEKIIGFDCEGFNLGHGIISLIQIALTNGKVYIFDIYENPDLISCGLKEIIESFKILKVINYCRNDCLNLKIQFDVNVKFVFDVSIAFHVIENKQMTLSNFKPAGFNQITAKYGVQTNSCKDDMKSVYISEPRYWLKRPLNIKMISYAAFDVASLVPYLYCEFLKRMNEKTEDAIWRLSNKMCST